MEPYSINLCVPVAHIGARADVLNDARVTLCGREGNSVGFVLDEAVERGEKVCVSAAFGAPRFHHQWQDVHAVVDDLVLVSAGFGMLRLARHEPAGWRDDRLTVSAAHVGEGAEGA